MLLGIYLRSIVFLCLTDNKSEKEPVSQPGKKTACIKTCFFIAEKACITDPTLKPLFDSVLDILRPVLIRRRRNFSTYKL